MFPLQLKFKKILQTLPKIEARRAEIMEAIFQASVRKTVLLPDG